MPSILPTVLERWSQGSAVGYDIFSRLLKDRIIFVGGDEGEVTTDSANLLISQLLYLDGEDHEKDIHLYINSPGGMVSAGLAVYDTMQFVRAPISTLCMGMAMSFGAVLLTAGTKGKRYSLPHARIMMHQPSGGFQGQASDIEITAREIQKLKKELYDIIAFHSGKSYKEIEKNSDRDYWMTSTEAKEYGMIDDVLVRNNK